MLYNNNVCHIHNLIMEINANDLFIIKALTKIIDKPIMDKCNHCIYPGLKRN
jgi:hypothetical protein